MEIGHILLTIIILIFMIGTFSVGFSLFTETEQPIRYVDSQPKEKYYRKEEQEQILEVQDYMELTLDEDEYEFD